MALDSVCAQADELDTPLGELGLELGEGAELGGADGSVVLGVGEEDDPAITNELVEVNGTTGGLSLEVGGNAAETEGLRTVSHCGGVEEVLCEGLLRRLGQLLEAQDSRRIRSSYMGVIVQCDIAVQVVNYKAGGDGSKKYVC